MAIQGLTNSIAPYTMTKPQDTNKAASATDAAQSAAGSKEAEKEAAPKTDRFEKGTDVKPPVYSKNQLTKGQINQLVTDAQSRMDSMSRMIQSMVVKQGQKSNLTLFGKQLYVSPQQSADAAKSIAEGGEYSVDAVATRILDMAKALSGGDASKIGKLREAVEKGFKAAGVDFGGKMPSITGETHTEVMKRFDAWEQEAKGSSATASKQ